MIIFPEEFGLRNFKESIIINTLGQLLTLNFYTEVKDEDINKRLGSSTSFSDPA